MPKKKIHISKRKSHGKKEKIYSTHTHTHSNNTQTHSHTQAVLERKLIELKLYIIKEKNSQINHLSSHFKNLGKKRTKSTQSKQEEGNNKEKSRKINEIGNRKTTEETNKKAWFFLKINTIANL